MLQDHIWKKKKKCLEHVEQCAFQIWSWTISRGQNHQKASCLMHKINIRNEQVVAI